MTPDQARAVIQEKLGVAATGDGPALAVTVPAAQWLDRRPPRPRAPSAASTSTSRTAVDWKDEGLEVLARVENLDAPFALTLRTRLGAGVTACPSLTSLWRGADWMERECYDMFGIRFEGHPDLRRILLPQDWEGHPLLKSYAVDTPHPPYR